MIILLDDVAAVTTDQIVSVSDQMGASMERVLQVEIEGTAQVDVYGRMSSSFTWQLIKSYTASDADIVGAFPQMKADISSWTSGNVSAAITGI